MSKVNLDALIPRADFVENTPNQTTSLVSEISLVHILKDGIGSVYSLLRKPDFQRETIEWDKVKICDLIQCFMDGNFVPSIILWKSPSSLIFVIDGSHRLSALIAYVNDDYGDKAISQHYFSFDAPDEDLIFAEECREYINKKIYPFAKIQEIYENPTKYSDKEVLRARNFMTFILRVQEIKNATVKDAERSFFKINQQGVALSTTEKILCFSRGKAPSIATRAIMKGGAGYQYWKDFTDENQAKVKEIAKQINSLLFKPPLMKKAKSHEFFPMGGNTSSAMPMVYDFLGIFNRKDGKQIKLEDDLNGDETLRFLVQARKVVWLLNSSHQSSLGLHPLVYFYTSTGAHQQTAFLAIAEVMMTLEKDKKLPMFTRIRSRFEDFLVKHKIFISQLVRKFGSRKKAEDHLIDFYSTLIGLLTIKNDEGEITSELRKKFNALNPEEAELEKTKRKRISLEVSNAIIIKEDLANCKRCKICGARLQHISISEDHILKQENYGSGNIENVQLAHPYCNTGYKNYSDHLEKLIK